MISLAVAAPAAVASPSFTVSNLTAVHDGNLVTVTLTATGLDAGTRATELQLGYANGVIQGSYEVPIVTEGVNTFGVADEFTFWELVSIILVFRTGAGPRSFTIPVTYAIPWAPSRNHP